MTVRIDRAGRIVVPKAVRDRLGLKPEVEIEIIEHADGALLRPRSDSPTMVYDGPLLVHQGRPDKNANWETLIDDVRNERMKDLL